MQKEKGVLSDGDNGNPGTAGGGGGAGGTAFYRHIGAWLLRRRGGGAPGAGAGPGPGPLPLRGTGGDRRHDLPQLPPAGGKRPELGGGALGPGGPGRRERSGAKQAAPLGGEAAAGDRQRGVHRRGHHTGVTATQRKNALHAESV